MSICTDIRHLPQKAHASLVLLLLLGHPLEDEEVALVPSAHPELLIEECRIQTAPRCVWGIELYQPPKYAELQKADGHDGARDGRELRVHRTEERP